MPPRCSVWGPSFLQDSGRSRKSRQHPSGKERFGLNWSSIPAKPTRQTTTHCRLPPRDAPMATSLGSGSSTVRCALIICPNCELSFPNQPNPQLILLRIAKARSSHPANSFPGCCRPGQCPANQWSDPDGNSRPQLPGLRIRTQWLTASCVQLDEHLLTPASINTLEVHGATNTRRSLLDHIFKPLVEDSAAAGITLGQVVNGIGAATKKLSRFGAPSPISTHPLLYANP